MMPSPGESPRPYDRGLMAQHLIERAFREEAEKSEIVRSIQRKQRLLFWLEIAVVSVVVAEIAITVWAFYL